MKERGGWLLCGTSPLEKAAEERLKEELHPASLRGINT